MKDLPPITEEQARAYDYRYQTRAETLLAVDDMLEAVIQVNRVNGCDWAVWCFELLWPRHYWRWATCWRRWCRWFSMLHKR